MTLSNTSVTNILCAYIHTELQFSDVSLYSWLGLRLLEIINSEEKMKKKKRHQTPTLDKISTEEKGKNLVSENLHGIQLCTLLCPLLWLI